MSHFHIEISMISVYVSKQFTYYPRFVWNLFQIFPDLRNRVWRNCNILYRNYISSFQVSTWNIHNHFSPYLEGVQLNKQNIYLTAEHFFQLIYKKRKKILAQFKNNFMWMFVCVLFFWGGGGGEGISPKLVPIYIILHWACTLIGVEVIKIPLRANLKGMLNPDFYGTSIFLFTNNVFFSKVVLLKLLLINLF